MSSWAVWEWNDPTLIEHPFSVKEGTHAYTTEASSAAHKLGHAHISEVPSWKVANTRNSFMKEYQLMLKHTTAFTPNQQHFSWRRVVDEHIRGQRDIRVSQTLFGQPSSHSSQPLYMRFLNNLHHKDTEILPKKLARSLRDHRGEVSEIANALANHPQISLHLAQGLESTWTPIQVTIVQNSLSKVPEYVSKSASLWLSEAPRKESVEKLIINKIWTPVERRVHNEIDALPLNSLQKEIMKTRLATHKERFVSTLQNESVFNHYSRQVRQAHISDEWLARMAQMKPHLRKFETMGFLSELGLSSQVRKWQRIGCWKNWINMVCTQHSYVPRLLEDVQKAHFQVRNKFETCYKEPGRFLAYEWKRVLISRVVGPFVAVCLILKVVVAGK